MSGRSSFLVQDLSDSLAGQVYAARPIASHQRNLDSLPCDNRLGPDRRRIPDGHGGPFRQRGPALQDNHAILNATVKFHVRIVHRQGREIKSGLNTELAEVTARRGCRQELLAASSTL